MYAASPLPAAGEVFLDARSDDRALRVSWHTDAGVVVLSMWRGGTCNGTFRLAVEDVPAFVELLRGGLQGAYDKHSSLLDRAFGSDLAG